MARTNTAVVPEAKPHDLYQNTTHKAKLKVCDCFGTPSYPKRMNQVR